MEIMDIVRIAVVVEDITLMIAFTTASEVGEDIQEADRMYGSGFV